MAVKGMNNYGNSSQCRCYSTNRPRLGSVGVHYVRSVAANHSPELEY